MHESTLWDEPKLYFTSGQEGSLVSDGLNCLIGWLKVWHFMALLGMERMNRSSFEHVTLTNPEDRKTKPNICRHSLTVGHLGSRCQVQQFPWNLERVVELWPLTKVRLKITKTKKTLMNMTWIAVELWIPRRHAYFDARDVWMKWCLDCDI